MRMIYKPPILGGFCCQFMLLYNMPIEVLTEMDCVQNPIRNLIKPVISAIQ